MSSRFRTLQRRLAGQQETEAIYVEKVKAMVDKMVTESVGHIAAENERLKAAMAAFGLVDVTQVKRVISHWSLDTGDADENERQIKVESPRLESLLGKIEDLLRARDS